MQGLDNIIDAAEHDLKYGHPNAKEQAFLEKMIDNAADDVRDALHDLQSIRDGYSATLQNCLGNLHTDGIQAAEGPLSPLPDLPDDPKQFTQV